MVQGYGAICRFWQSSDRRVAGIVLLLVLSMSAAPARPQSADDGQRKEREERLEEMRRLARAIRLIEDKADDAVELLPEPLVRYDDQPRFMTDASLWAWGRGGRPVAALKVEFYSFGESDDRRLYGLVSLAPGLITAEGADWRWSAREPGVEIRAMPDAPDPADSEAARLSQMKQLARRFTAFQQESGVRGRMELRLGARQIHRYTDSQVGLLDGAIFTFAFGTNPEVLLLIEARRLDSSAPAWRFGLARIGGAEVSVSLDGREVWKQPTAQPPSVRETYMNRWIVTARNADP